MAILRLMMMLKGESPDGFNGIREQRFPAVGLTADEDEIYGSDEFRMYAYKIKRCPRTRSHDWTECPYAHRGEKATRRDPRQFSYCAVTCPAFRNGGSCHRGDACEFAHGVFEYWLHPARYRTRVCNAGGSCQRKVCFFAHSPEQLRSEQSKYHHKCRFAYRPRRAAIVGRDLFSGNEVESDGGENATRASPMKTSMNENDSVWELEVRASGLLRSFSQIQIKEDNNDASGLDWSHIDWISKLVE